MTTAFELTSHAGKEIKSARGWGQKGSAGFARTWSGDGGLEALRNLLDTNTGTAGFEVRRGVVGAKTSFDGYRGDHAHDLLLSGEAAGGKTVVGIEASGEKDLGRTVAQFRDEARRKIGRGEGTNALDRLQALTRNLAGWEAGASPKRLELRYGLFAAVAGTVAAAVDEEADQAVFCVHELVTSKLKPDKQKQNDDDLRDFIYEVFGEIVTGDDPGWVVGPLKLHGGSERIPQGMPLFIAKLSTPPAGAS